MTKRGHPPSKAVLTAMQNALRHRGPDGEGLYEGGSVGLIHTRLAIIDPDHGQQPFVAENGTVLIANGEIYNDPSIRADLKDAPYKTGSDNESALHLYSQFGMDFVHHLRGMYALVIYDPAKECIVLARDPFGIKPLYFAQTGDAFWFASEPQALLSVGIVSRKENSLARDQLFALQFTCGTETAFQGIERLEPGGVMVIKNGDIAESFKIDPLQHSIESNGNTVAEFDRLWMDSVDVHRRSDVPYGIFLSSGTDSSAILTAMARLERLPLVTFTAGFHGGTMHDERDQAAKLAQTVGAEHRPIEIGASDFWACLPALVQSLDDPVADYAAIPTYLLGQEAAKSVKVVLTGEGGDEVFAGYGRYRRIGYPWPFRRRPWTRSLLEKTGVLSSQARDWRASLDQTEQNLAKQSLSSLQRAQALDIAHWLPNDLLIKVDRCLMAHSVEGRVPFLDPPLARFGFGLADQKKIRKRLGKIIIRRWLAQHRPESDPFARKKGFSVPVGHWISEKGAELAPLIATQEGVAACCRSDAVESLFKNTGADTALPKWALLFYALWHQCHIKDVGMSGSVQDILAEA